MASSSNKRAAAPATAEDFANNRKNLRALIQQVESNHEELTAVDSSGLAEVQCQANEMFEISRQEARGAALDANLLHGVSRLGAEQAGKLDKQSPEEFVKRLLAKYGMGEGGRQKLNFPILANDLESEGVFRTVPAVTFLLDSNWQPAAPKEKKQREKKQRTTDEPMQTAKTVQIDQLQEGQENKAQVARMETMYKVIKKKAGEENARVNVFRLLLHPTSFSQTVENFFDLCFLVKDGRVAMEAGADGAYVKRSTPPEADAYERGLDRVQNIVKLDYTTYKKLVARWCKEGPPFLADRGD